MTSRNPHLFVIMNTGEFGDEDRHPIATAEQRAMAREVMAELGLTSLPIFEVGGQGDADATGESLHVTEPSSYLEEGYDLPSAHDIAGALQVLLDPAGDEDERAEVLERIGVCPGPGTTPATVEVRSFEAAAIMSRDAGLVIRIGKARFFVTVTSG